MNNALVITPLALDDAVRAVIMRFTGNPADREAGTGMALALAGDPTTLTHRGCNFGVASATFLAALDAGQVPPGDPADDALVAQALAAFVVRADADDADPWDLGKINVRVGGNGNAGVAAAGLVAHETA